MSDRVISLPCRQHQRDYKMSEREVLEDLVSYCPQLVGGTSNQTPAEYTKSIGRSHSTHTERERNVLFNE